jgi:hypothetical protein
MAGDFLRVLLMLRSARGTLLQCRSGEITGQKTQFFMATPGGMNFFDDDDIIPTTTSKPKPTSHPARKPQNGNGHAPVDTPAANDGLAWGDSSVVTGDGLVRAKATAERSLRFALVPKVAPVGALSHFVNSGQKKGFFRCAGETCPLCLREDPKWQGVALVVVYENADNAGKIGTKTPELSIAYITMTASHFRVISDACEGASPESVDWLLSFDRRRYSFRPCSTVPRYVSAGMQEQVAALARPLIGKLAGKAGRIATALELSAMTTNSANLGDIGDLETD